MKVILRSTVNRPVYHSVKHTSYITFITVRQLRFDGVGRHLCREDGSLLFYCLRQRNRPRIWVLRDPLPYFVVLGSGGPELRIYTDQPNPVISLGTAFQFCRPLQLADLWWKCSNPAPCEEVDWLSSWSSEQTQQKTQHLIILVLLHDVAIATDHIVASAFIMLLPSNVCWLSENIWQYIIYCYCDD
jgi:hypothetical protein